MTWQGILDTLGSATLTTFWHNGCSKRKNFGNPCLWSLLHSKSTSSGHRSMTPKSTTPTAPSFIDISILDGAVSERRYLGAMFLCFRGACVSIYLILNERTNISKWSLRYRKILRPSLVQIMTSSLFGAKLLYESMLVCYLDHGEYISQQSSFRKCIWVFCLQSGSHFALASMSIKVLGIGIPLQSQVHVRLTFIETSISAC